MATAAPFRAARAASGRATITWVVMLPTFLQVLDSTIATVALPHMQSSLNAATDTITWVLTSYIVASAVATPLTGWLSGFFGRKRVFVAAIAGFMLASMACGAAQSLEQMVGFRLLQGACGAFLVPLGQTFLLDAYPKEKHGQALALWSMGVMVGPVMGPVIGGWLTDSFNWRWVFYVNVPFGLLALFGAAVFLPDAEDERRRFDMFGFTTLAIGVMALQLMLDRGQQLDWLASWEVRIEAGIVLGSLWMFGVHLALGSETILDRRMMRDRNVMVGFAFVTLIGALMISTSALIPPMLESLYGYPVVTTGLVTAPRGFGTMLGTVLVGRFVGRADPRYLMGLGLVLTAWSLRMMTGFSPQMGMESVIVSGVIQGVGAGLIFVPLNILAFATISAQLRTDAASFYSLLRNLGSSVGVSLSVGVLARQTQIAHADVGAALTPFTLPVDPTITQALGATGNLVMSFLNAQVNLQAGMIAYLDVYYLLMWVVIAMIPMLLLMRRPATGKAEPPIAIE